ncbi:MAG: HAD hydrolase-like protein [Pseudomonadota bacterium]
MAHDLVLFDLDGTLSDPLEGIGRSINYSLVYFGYEPLEFSRLTAFVGPPIDETFRIITGINTAFDLEALVTKYRERYAEVGYSENVLYPGIAEALATLSEMGVPMAVCTSKRVEFAEQILEMFELRHHFLYIDGGEIGIHKWQQIEALLLAGKVTQSSVMVGDRSVDMVAAHRNGLKAGAVLWGYGSHAELSGEHPFYFFGSPNELLQLAPS